MIVSCFGCPLIFLWNMIRKMSSSLPDPGIDMIVHIGDFRTQSGGPATHSVIRNFSRVQLSTRFFGTVTLPHHAFLLFPRITVKSSRLHDLGVLNHPPTRLIIERAFPSCSIVPCLKPFVRDKANIVYLAVTRPLCNALTRHAALDVVDSLSFLHVQDESG